MKDNKVKKTEDEIRIEIESDPILSKIDSKSLSIDENIAIIQKYNENRFHVETKEYYAIPKNKRSSIPHTYSREKKIPTKRCG